MIAFNWNVLEWPGMNTAFLVSFIASILAFLDKRKRRVAGREI